jgi:hypothetical protein
VKAQVSIKIYRSWTEVYEKYRDLIEKILDEQERGKK